MAAAPTSASLSACCSKPRVSVTAKRSLLFWPVYGERDEVCFPFFPSRSAVNVQEALGLRKPEGGVLLTDCNPVYEHYAGKTGITHALCWAHSRRTFLEAQSVEPQGVLEALEQIRKLYAIEEDIREQGLVGENQAALSARTQQATRRSLGSGSV
jgi:transposase